MLREKEEVEGLGFDEKEEYLNICYRDQRNIVVLLVSVIGLFEVGNYRWRLIYIVNEVCFY